MADDAPPAATEGTEAIVPWSVDRLGDLVALVQASLPDEGLGADDLLACTFEDDGIVLGLPDGAGAVAVVRRRIGSGWLAAVQVVAVAPEVRRRGIGRRLLAAAEAWATEEGASHLGLGGAAPWYLWPGVDAASTPALCLAEAAGFAPVGAEVNMVLPATFRAEPSGDLAVERALDDATATQVGALVARRWPQWSAEVGRALEQGTCHVAVRAGEVVGVACHSVNRPGWLGPMATHPEHRGVGVGSALVSAVCRDLMVAGHPTVEIAWVGPVRFYAKLGAEVGRVFRTYARPLG